MNISDYLIIGGFIICYLTIGQDIREVWREIPKQRRYGILLMSLGALLVVIGAIGLKSIFNFLIDTP